MRKRILTIDDLVKFCETHNFVKFDSQEYGYQLSVQAPALFETKENEDPYSLYADCLVMHTGTNRNHSNLTEEGAKKAMKTIAYKPVLANFCEVDGVRDFTSHDFIIDEDGNYKYLEHQIGCFTSKKPYLKDDPENPDRKNVWAEVVIPREYTDAVEIIERKGGTKVSVELDILQFEYDLTNKEIVFNDVVVRGLTCLGLDPDTGKEVKEGMEGASIKLEDFSSKNNSLFQNTIAVVTQAVVEQLSNRFNLTDNKGKEVDTVEFENEDIKKENEEQTESNVEEETPVESEVADSPEDENSPDEFSEETTETSSDASTSQKFNLEKFEASLDDIQTAIYTLVNETYSESDNDWYGCKVYQESKSIVMIGYYSGKCYKQSYKVRKDVYSLVGDRVPVKAIYVTEDEEAELEKLRSNYAEVSEKLQKYEAEPEKISLFDSNEYLNIADTKDFEELKKTENHFDMSVEDLKSTLDKMLLEFAKGNKIDFSENNEKKNLVGAKRFTDAPNKANYKRYGNLFD